MKTILKVIILSLCMIIGSSMIVIIPIVISKVIASIFNGNIAFIVNCGTIAFLSICFSRLIIRDNTIKGKMKDSVQDNDIWHDVKTELPPEGMVVNVRLSDGRYSFSWICEDGAWAFNIHPTHWCNKRNNR